jgi:hypothetical protein
VNKSPPSPFKTKIIMEKFSRQWGEHKDRHECQDQENKKMVKTSHSWAEPAGQEKLPRGGLVPSLFNDKGNILRYIITI